MVDPVNGRLWSQAVWGALLCGEKNIPVKSESRQRAMSFYIILGIKGIALLE